MLRRPWKEWTAAPTPLRLGELRALQARCVKRTLSERRRLPGLPADRADIIPAGLAVLLSFMEHARKRVVRVGAGGVRDGLILTMLREATETPGSARSRA
jgi:exopolyphosphatase/guanosine-5'-triphosphate,3'-diphosphate pyrophosphatase